MHQIIQIHVDAPTKPALGQPCNGCGVCCASAPCPIGVLVSRRTHGACAALVWAEDAGLYRCGLIFQPRAHLPPALRWSAPWLVRWARRSISAGSGCDADLVLDTARDA